MRRLLLDCRSGISGDMFAGALLDLLDDDAFVVRELRKLGMGDEFSIAVNRVSKKGISAKKFDVVLGGQKQHTHTHQHGRTHEHTHTHAAQHRTLHDINILIDRSTLAPRVKTLAKKIFRTLGAAEAKAHAVPINQVHFHEVGAVDSIVDIVTAALLVTKLGITEIVCGSLTEGHGTVHIDHGDVSLPVPAVRELLKNIPLTRINIPKELITPTGAAILATLKTRHVEAVDMETCTIGVGAGTRDLTFPNVLRAAIPTNSHLDRKVLIETHIDDMTPEMIPYLVDTCIARGAVDAFASPCTMKKGRVGTLLSVLCEEARKDSMIQTIFEETSTFGMRVRTIDRVILKREIKSLRTRYGKVSVKVGTYNGSRMSAKAEFDQARAIAEKQHIPLKRIYNDIAKSLNDLKK